MVNVCVFMLLVSCCWVSISKATENLKLPSYIDVCYRDDPQVSKCIKRSIEKIVPHIKGGSVDLDLDPLDPLNFRNLTFTYKSPVLGGTVNVPITVLKGLTNLNVLDVRIMQPPKKLILDFDVFLPRLSTKTDYKLKGNVLTTGVQMNGHADIDFESLTLTYHLEGDVQTINETDYLILKSFYWRFNGDNIQRLHVLNEDIVEGRPLLSRLVVRTLRSGWRPLLNQMVPAILPRTDPSLKDMFSKFFKKFPYDVLFPKKTR